jgi:hypothetical protein
VPKPLLNKTSPQIETATLGAINIMSQVKLFQQVEDVSSIYFDLRRYQRLITLALDKSRHAYRITDQGEQIVDPDDYESVEFLLELYLRDTEQLISKLDETLGDLLATVDTGDYLMKDDVDDDEVNNESSINEIELQSKLPFLEFQVCDNIDNVDLATA